MSLWEKIKSGLEEGLETLSEKSVETSKVIKLKWERRGLQKEIHERLVELGSIIYQMNGSDKTGEIQTKSESLIQQLKDLEKALQQKDAEIEDLTDKIDKNQVKGLKKDLELGDGTIEQIVVQEGTPLAGKPLSEIKFPRDVLIGTVVRDEKVIIPDGKTVLNAGDKVTLLGKKEDVEKVMEKLIK